MRDRTLFNRLCLYICPDALSANEFAVLQCCARDGGAALVESPQAPGVTHIVSHPTEFQRFADDRRDRFFEIARPEWLSRCFTLQTCIPVDNFSANPSLFFAGLAIAAGSIDKDPRKVIDGLITHFGGQIVDDAADASGATHVLSADGARGDSTVTEAQQAFCVTFTEADVERQVELWGQWLDERPASLDFSIPGCLVAFMGKHAGLDTIHYVNYAWIEECVRKRHRLNEAPYTKAHSSNSDQPLPNWKSRLDVKVEDLKLSAEVYLGPRAAQASTAIAELAVMKKVSPERLTLMHETLGGMIVLLAQHIPTPLKDTLVELLKAAKAKVATVPLGDSYGDVVCKVVTNASFVVCRYESGLEYKEALRQKKQIKSVFWVLAGLGVPGDGGSLREALMRPVKSAGGIDGMESFVITLSGFSSRTQPSREDVQIAIQATGACVLPVLSRSHSTHLLCFEAKGEKFKKAQSWNFDNILGHEWLLECLQQWKHVPEAAYRMSDDATATATTERLPSGEDVTTRAVAKNGEAGTKPASRFDVGDILEELDETSPTTKRARTASKLNTATEAASKLLDTPTKNGSRSTRRSSNGADADSVPIPEDFEFHFGKAGKAKGGKGRAAASRVTFTDQKSVKTKGHANKELVGDQQPATSTDAQEKPTKPAAKKTTAAQKRKAVASLKNDAEDEGSTTTTTTPPAKKKKAIKSTATVALSSPDSGGRLFLLTGTREECAINESIILSLGGRVSQVGRIYDPLCTHIICNELKRTEKFVAGCAAGKWVLKQSYVDACSEAGKFVDEAPHEWGTDERDPDHMDPRIWPPAPGYWRAARAGHKPGAFAGWRFLVHPKSVPPPEMCERVILASDGHVLPLDQEYEWIRAAASATKAEPVLALIHAELSHRDVWIKKFKTHKLRCVNASFLIDYLTKDQTNRPRLDDYTL